MVTTIRNNVGSNLYRPFALGQRLFFVSLPTGPWPACYLLGMPLPCQICAVRFAFEAANGILPENRADAKDREKVKETKAIYAKRAADAAAAAAAAAAPYSGAAGSSAAPTDDEDGKSDTTDLPAEEAPPAAFSTASRRFYN